MDPIFQEKYNVQRNRRISGPTIVRGFTEMRSFKLELRRCKEMLSRICHLQLALSINLTLSDCYWPVQIRNLTELQ